MAAPANITTTAPDTRIGGSFALSTAISPSAPRPLASAVLITQN